MQEQTWSLNTAVLAGYWRPRALDSFFSFKIASIARYGHDKYLNTHFRQRPLLRNMVKRNKKWVFRENEKSGPQIKKHLTKKVSAGQLQMRSEVHRERVMNMKRPFNGRERHFEKKGKMPLALPSIQITCGLLRVYGND